MCNYLDGLWKKTHNKHSNWRWSWWCEIWLDTGEGQLVSWVNTTWLLATPLIGLAYQSRSLQCSSLNCTGNHIFIKYASLFNTLYIKLKLYKFMNTCKFFFLSWGRLVQCADIREKERFKGYYTKPSNSLYKSKK